MCARFACAPASFGWAGFLPRLDATNADGGAGNVKAWVVARPSKRYSDNVSAEIFPRVTVDPKICFGKPTIRGMRIRVSDVLSMLAGGMTAEQILADFPYLEREDIQAAIAYAAKATDQRLAFAPD